MRFHRSIAWMVLAGGAVCPVPAQTTPDPSVLRAVLRATSRHVAVGKPVWLEFTVVNESDDQVELAVPGVDLRPDEADQGLPLAHVFSGTAFTALTIRGAQGRSWDVAVKYEPPSGAATLRLAPHGTVGIRLDAAKYYPALRTPGHYRLVWKPYAGALVSNEVLIDIAPLKQAVIHTDRGDMTIRFFYADAPNTIENFVELVSKGFYNDLTFHRVLTGVCIQGGCPRGDGRGIRPDGKLIPGEQTGRPQTRGMVSMSLAGDDPDSASCQFFITNTRVAEWDGLYTVFGALEGEESLATLDALMATPTDETGKPLQPLYMRSVRLSDVPFRYEDIEQ